MRQNGYNITPDPLGYPESYYVPPFESKETSPKLAKKFPLNIISPKSHAFLNSCYANMDDKLRVQGKQFVLISKLDASERNIKNNDKVKVFNEI